MKCHQCGANVNHCRCPVDYATLAGPRSEPKQEAKESSYAETFDHLPTPDAIVGQRISRFIQLSAEEFARLAEGKPVFLGDVVIACPSQKLAHLQARAVQARANP